MSTKEERIQVLRMIEKGDLTPEQGAILLKVLDGQRVVNHYKEPLELEDDRETVVSDQTPVHLPPDAHRWKSWWMIPLWIGVGITILGAFLIFTVLQSNGIGFWFYCAWVPFLVGLSIIILAWYSRISRWLHVRIRGKEGEKHQSVSFSIPLPLGITAWLLRNFGHWIPQLKGTQVDELILALQESATPETPFFIEVDDEKGNEHVEVYIG